MDRTASAPAAPAFYICFSYLSQVIELDPSTRESILLPLLQSGKLTQKFGPEELYNPTEKCVWGTYW